MQENLSIYSHRGFKFFYTSENEIQAPENFHFEEVFNLQCYVFSLLNIQICPAVYSGFNESCLSYSKIIDVRQTVHLLGGLFFERPGKQMVPGKLSNSIHRNKSLSVC